METPVIDPKEKIRSRYRTSKADELEKIPAKPRPSLFEDDSDKNVAVYARVSTLATQQTSSFELQQTHYTNLIDRQSGWELVKIYSDEGISGTSLAKREGFKQMIEDCKKGIIDLIVVKSVSRFSRNVVDGITSIDELKSLNPPVGVYFENEGLYTLTNDSEFPLTLMQTMAQEESRIKSNQQDMSYEMRTSNGIFLTPPLLGYDHDQDGNLIVNQDEARTVKLIFFMYLRGYSSAMIAETLTALGRKTKKGNAIWSASSVLNVLHNERHCGSILTRKTWTPNYKNHKSRKNRGDRNQYRAHDHHEAIISRDDFNAAQKMLANAKYGGRCFLPEVTVILGGELNGYVSINPRWASFTAEDYRLASQQAEDEDDKISSDILVGNPGEIDMRGYEIVRVEHFSFAIARALTISKETIKFSRQCILSLGEPEHVQVLIHPEKKMLVVRPCDKDNKLAIGWATSQNGVMRPWAMSGRAFLGTIFELFNWSLEHKYKFRGRVEAIGTEKILEFDLSQFETSLPGKTFVNESLSFGDGYYTYKAVTDKPPAIESNSITYNIEPDINPTPPEVLGDNINHIVAELMPPNAT